ncbi:MAG: hypothetical protein R2877_03740 [Bdellovibrionota bacterium]
MEGRIRVSTDNGDVDLEHLKIIEVVSISPVKKYLTKQSWNIGFGWRRIIPMRVSIAALCMLKVVPDSHWEIQMRGDFISLRSPTRFFKLLSWNATNYQIGPSGTSMIVAGYRQRFSTAAGGQCSVFTVG